MTRGGMSGFAAAALLAASALAPALAQAGDRPALADEVEKRFNDRFLFATRGEGSYTVYQRIEANLATPREVVCMMRGECYVELAAVPEPALEAAARDSMLRRKVVALFAAARDDYGRVLAAKPEDKPAAEKAWLDRAARIGPCVTERRCGDE